MGGRNAYFNRLYERETRLHAVNVYITFFFSSEVFVLVFLKKCLFCPILSRKVWTPHAEYDAIGLSPSGVNGLPLGFLQQTFGELFKLMVSFKLCFILGPGERKELASSSFFKSTQFCLSARIKKKISLKSGIWLRYFKMGKVTYT